MAAGWKGSGQAGCDVATLKWVTRKEHPTEPETGIERAHLRLHGVQCVTREKLRESKLCEERVGIPARSHEGARTAPRVPEWRRGASRNKADEAAESDAERFPFKTRTIPFERSFK